MVAYLVSVVVKLRSDLGTNWFRCSRRRGFNLEMVDVTKIKSLDLGKH